MATVSLRDRSFLRRCCETYNWDMAINFCEDTLHPILTNQENSEDCGASVANYTLSDGLHHTEYDESVSFQNCHAKRQYQAAIDQLTSRDEWGNTPLHAACYNKPPLRVVTSILLCASLASLNVHLVLTKDGSTPLNIACGTGASTDVLRVLLTPPRPLQDGGLAVTIADTTGSTPLTELITFYNLQRRGPWFQQALPLHKVVFFTKTTPNTISLPRSPTHMKHSDNNHVGQAQNKSTEELYEQLQLRVTLLLRAAWSAISKKTSSIGKWTSYVHAMALFAEACPLELTELLVRSFPEMTKAPTETGFLPLHLAIRSTVRVRYNNKGHQHLQRNSLAARRSFVIQQLVEAFPESGKSRFPARKNLSCSQGRNLLCQAIASGLKWHTVGPEDEEGPLQCLALQNPTSIVSFDEETGLYPFLLAATTYRPESNQGVATLDSIYSLLRSEPSVLIHAAT